MNQALTVDLLGEAVAGLRVGRGTVRRFRKGGSWGLRFSGLTGSGFHVLLRGRAWLLSADAPPVEVHAGDVVLAPAGADHGFADTPRALRGLPPVPLGSDDVDDGDAEWLCGAYRLDPHRTHPYFAALPDLLVVTPGHDLRPVLALLDAGARGEEVARAALLDLVLIHVLRQWHGEPRMPAQADAAVAGALRRMHEEPGAGWTVERLSELAGLSRTAFSRRFTAAVGTPPRDYLIGRRLDRAARLLRETDAPLTAIAREVGYSTGFALAGAFRREFGVAPGRFRTAARAR
jgi:AraC-like DNA-binding protein